MSAQSGRTDFLVRLAGTNFASRHATFHFLGVKRM
jgi:hypothetical protein